MLSAVRRPWNIVHLSCQIFLQSRGAPDLELYDQRFNPNSELSEFDIYIPIN